MPTTKNLLPGQYQIGDLVMGRHTAYQIQSFDEQAYNINAQDQQRSVSDEIDFGQDSFAPQTAVMKIWILDNSVLPGMAGYTGLMLPDAFNTQGQERKDALATEWRGDDVRGQWGAQKPLKCCGRDGVVRVIYGRPRKFHSTKQSRQSEGWSVDAEFMRVDTLAYSDTEHFLTVAVNADPVNVSRTAGSVASWMRFILLGPAVHPIITFGEITIEMDYTLDSDESIEISSYPWVRRVINNEGFNRSTKVITDTPYLDQIKFPANATRAVSWDATGTSGTTSMIVLWRDAWAALP